MDLNLNELKSKLQELGAPEAHLDKIINEIGIVILNKIVILIKSKLNDEQRITFDNISQDDLPSYLNSVKDQITYPSDAELENIYQEVWNSYIAKVKN